MEDLVVEIEKHLSGGVPQLRSYMISPPETFQDKMNALFVALFTSAGDGFASRVWEKKDVIMQATAGPIDVDEEQVVLLRAIEVFCQNATPGGLKEVSLLLRWLYNAGILEKEHILTWYKEGSTGPAKDSPLWESAKFIVEYLEYSPEIVGEDDSESEDEWGP
ncbi:hypothetical protein QQ045_018261 [Rhodiola kirilowii]